MKPTTSPIISFESVYKIFGSRPTGAALHLARSGVDKSQIKSATGHVLGLNDVTFTVNQGEIFVIMGLSGSGKSTALRAINKLHDVTVGQVKVDGVDVQSLKGRELQNFRRRYMGMVFQHFALFPHRNVLENVCYGLTVQKVRERERTKAGFEALELVGLKPYAESMPSELSGGMKQRVGLARALASDAEVLLMDEPFSALDPLIRRQMQDEMLEIHKNLKKTVLFITHDLNEALRIGDRVCMMKDGAVVQIGSPKDILIKPANAYVVDFIKDVNQGRVMQVKEAMHKTNVIEPDTTLSEAISVLQERCGGGAFVVDVRGCPTHLVTLNDCVRLQNEMHDNTQQKTHASSIRQVAREGFNVCHVDDTLNDIYPIAGEGLPLAVCDNRGKLVGELSPHQIVRALGTPATVAAPTMTTTTSTMTTTTMTALTTNERS